MAYSFIFGTACIGLTLVTLVWAVLLFIPRPGQLLLFFGPAGTLSAAIPILGAWMPTTFEPLWLVIQATCMFWLMSFLLIGLAILFAFVLQTTRHDKVVAVACGGTGLLLNAAALLAFMWAATVSPGGV